MKQSTIQSAPWFAMLALVLVVMFSQNADAAIDGVTGTQFDLVARPDFIYTPDGDSLLIWGYGMETGNGYPTYPGPTMIVNQGDVVTVTLRNELFEPNMPVSIIFPGQENVVATGGTDGLLTKESNDELDTVTYTFTASNPGTYMYQSGTRQELQTEMGLFGALIVRPAVADQAYNHPDTAFDHEYLFILSEMDPEVHYEVEFGFANEIDNTSYNPVLWFINGRNGPDTMADANIPWMPTQPYNSLARVHPGEKALMRVVGASRNMHPFHTHGNHFTLIGRDGRMLESTPGAGADISEQNFTLQTIPGATYDALWDWTGYKLGWDIYGTVAQNSHTCTDGDNDSFDDTSHEYCPDHNKPIPVTLPELQDLTFGGFYSGSPFLGVFGDLPPGEGGLNLDGGMFYMWHSHNEKEIVNNDIFPGGMMTMMIVEPPGVPIPK